MNAIQFVAIQIHGLYSSVPGPCALRLSVRTETFHTVVSELHRAESGHVR